MERLRQQLAALDGKDYAAYQSLRGKYGFPGFCLIADQVPKDAYAPPDTGVYRVQVTREACGLISNDTATRDSEIATRDYLARQIHAASSAIGGGRRGTGNSGVIAIAPPGQVVLDRSSVIIDGNTIEARMFLGLPASGRTINGAVAEAMVCEELPAIIARSLSAETLDRRELSIHQQVVEDAIALRDQLTPKGLVAFVADGSVLPRASGIDPRPLTQRAVPFRSPDSLSVTLDTPHGGPVRGMGIPEGVTLIVGGGYHGKSTLLAAMAEGVYDHVPGDGRERCVTIANAASVSAAPGRAIAGTDISAFIGVLPDGRDPGAFTSENASGSTSQAASISEAIEIGARVLLMDEDSSATNFLVRDARMQQLVPGEEEPITVFLDRVRSLRTDLGVSTILVMGGSGDYFDVADTVVRLADYTVRDVTTDAKRIAATLPTSRSGEGIGSFAPPVARAPLPDGIDPRNEYGHRSIRAPASQRIVFGRSAIDLGDVPGFVEPAQALAVGMAIELMTGSFDGDRPLRAAVDQLLAQVAEGGLDILDARRGGGLASFRGLEVASALNRLRGAQVHQLADGAGNRSQAPY